MTISPKLRLGAVAHGRAILCLQSVASGETVFDLSGRIVPSPAMHTLQIAEGVHLKPDAASWALINHSCSPNCVIDIEGRRIVASREILPDEELTFNYLTTEWDMAAPFPCRCGAAHCPGTIRGCRVLNPVQRAAIRPTTAPYLLQLALRDGAGRDGEIPAEGHLAAS